MHAIANSLGPAVVALLCMCTAAVAGEPAVSGPNGKFAVEGGGGADDGEGVATGSFALPLGHDFGHAGRRRGRILRRRDAWRHGALHLFTRDPSRYLFGVYGSYHTWDPDPHLARGVGRRALHRPRHARRARRLREALTYPNVVNGFAVPSLDDDHLFGQADAGYYITDDFKIYAGYRYINETSFGAAGTEYLIRGLRGAGGTVRARRLRRRVRAERHRRRAHLSQRRR